MFKQSYSNVPIELIHYAHQHKMHKAMGLYLLMKASCDGQLTLTAYLKSALMGLLNIKDDRSFNKYLKKLKDENWIGYDELRQIYYIRGTKDLRKRYCFHERSTVVFNIASDAPYIKDFIHGAIIGHEVKRRNKARNGRIKKLAGSSALRKESAIQELSASGKISEYIGLSLSAIGKFLGVSQSQADRIKIRLQTLGYITVRARFKVVHTSNKPDFLLIKHLPSNRRYSVKRKKSKGEVMYEFKERTYDEIFSSMGFKKQRVKEKSVQSLGIGTDAVSENRC